MDERARRWSTVLGAAAAGAAGTLLLLMGGATLEHLLVGGETRQWCEGTQGYDGPNGPLERCVRERDDGNLLADDVHRLELHRADVPERYARQPWPFGGEDVEVDFGPDSVTVTDGDGVTVTYPNSLYDDGR